MRSYMLGTRSAATAVAANAVGAVLWNPSTNRSLFVTQVSWAKTVGTVDNLGMVKTSARGTQTTSLAAAAQNDVDGDSIPVSGAAIDTAWSVAPTILSATAYMFRWNLPATVGAGFILPMVDPIRIAPGQGLALLTPPAVILQPADVSFWWRE